MMAPEPRLVVVDTSVVSILMRGGRNEQAAYYQEQFEGRRAVVSFQTLEELWFGAYKGGWADARNNGLARQLDQYGVIGSSPELVQTCAHLRSERESVGRRLASADAWIAATALLLKCPLATDDGDFIGIPNLELIRAQVS